MSAVTPSAADEAVTTVPEPGTMVWCPNGDGNRILDVEDPWPMRCPQCSDAMTTEKPDTYTVPTETVNLPRVGDIVYLRISQQIFRPAIVIGIGGDEHTGEPTGRLHLHVFKNPNDPNPPALSEDVGWAMHGDRIGGWLHRGPEPKKPDTFESPIED